jgi:hypothetical protein
MKAIDIDFDSLLFAYRDDSVDNAYYLDTEYGSIRLVHRQLKDLQDLTDEIEIFHDRFLYVPKISKETVLDDLHDFMNTVEDISFRRLLVVAFESPVVIDSFRKITAQNPVVRQQLENYLQNKAKARLLSWLAANALTIAKVNNQDGLEEEKVD